IVDRGGVLMIFGDFGQPENAKYELIFLVLSIVSHAPTITAFSLHSISSLKEHRKSLISNRSLRMTNQMLEIFHLQLKGVILHVFIPVLIFVMVNLLDTRLLFSDAIHASIRFVSTMLFITNPFQFSLVYIVKTSRYRKLATRIRSDWVGRNSHTNASDPTLPACSDSHR
ncbi:hypothetical protein PMAYCL1PPCAC_20499, partial [Pristionchus mayeri]